MFKKPAYSPTELSDFIQGLKTLEALRNQAEQKSRLNKPEERDLYLVEQQRYTQNIKSAQLVLEKMLQKAGK